MLKLSPIPQKPPIDRARAGTLRVALHALGGLLRLPEGQEVVGVRASQPYGPGGPVELEIVVEGAGMPLRSDGLGGPAPEPVSLNFVTDHRGAERRVMAHWEHEPSNRWLFLNWEPAP